MFAAVPARPPARLPAACCLLLPAFGTLSAHSHHPLGPARTMSSPILNICRPVCVHMRGPGLQFRTPAAVTTR